jgi:L-fuculose-phosphate aldolase
MIAVGESLQATLALAVEVETLAEIYWRALQIAEPRVLDEREMRDALARFGTYRAGRSQ